MKIKVTDTNSMMDAFGIKPGDVFEVVRELKETRPDPKTNGEAIGRTYKYIVRFEKTDSLIGINSRMAEEIK